MNTKLLWLLASLIVLSMLILPCCGSSDDDDDDSGGNDDDSVNDDDTTDDDDQTDDDTADDDDAVDDDVVDDDDLVDDDDQAPQDPYESMTPVGDPMESIISIASHMSTGAEYSREREFEIEQAAAANLHYMRRGFYWNQIEPADDNWTFEGYDVMVDLIADAGLSPIAMVTRGVSWAMPNESPSDIAPEVFGDFAGTVAARYADDIEIYEIWNEQNSTRFWKPAPDPNHYGVLLEAAYNAIHAADPNSQVIFGGMSPFDDVNLFDDRGVWNFLARVGEEHPDLCDFIDGVAIHPYTFLQQPGPEFNLDVGFYHYLGTTGHVAEVRGMLDELGCADLPIHFTEMGWPSLLIGNHLQAAFLARGAILAASAEVASYCWYTFYDEEPDSSIPTEDYFGLYELPDGVTDPAPKPSWNAMTALVDALEGFRYAGNLGETLTWNTEKAYSMVFKNDADDIVVALWKTGTEAISVQVPIPQNFDGEIELLDLFGDEIEPVQATDSEITIELSGDVQYLRFMN